MTATALKIMAFAIGSLPIVVLSWRSLKSFRNHGFSRFFAWELILWLLIINIRFWFKDPLSVNQLFSWFLLLVSIYPLIDSVLRIKSAGMNNHQRFDPTLYGFERTTQLVTSGVFRYIRHPMYASLVYLTWGIALKNPGVQALAVAMIATALLIVTMKMEETENIAFFGDKYRAYIRKTKMFIPYLL